jgi:hypothetical protein
MRLESETVGVSAAVLGARASTASSVHKAAPKLATTASATGGDQSVTVSPDAKFGIPCVY